MKMEESNVSLVIRSICFGSGVMVRHFEVRFNRPEFKLCSATYQMKVLYIIHFLLALISSSIEWR